MASALLAGPALAAALTRVRVGMVRIATRFRNALGRAVQEI